MADEPIPEVPTDAPATETPEATLEAAVVTEPAGPPSIANVFAKFADYDTKKRGFITFDKFNKLSKELALPADKISADTKFAAGFVTFGEVAKIAGLEFPELPVSINLALEAYRKADEESSGSIPFMSFTRRMGLVTKAAFNPEDVSVTFEEALQKAAGPRQEYKLNVFKDGIRKFGKDGNGTLKKDEFEQLMRYLDMEMATDKAQLGMQDVLELVISDKEHPIFVQNVNMNEVYKAFDWCDVDHNNVLDTDELAKAMRLAGQNPSQALFRQLKAEFDQNNDGVFDFHEFTNIVCENFISPDAMQEKAMEAFRVFDTDNSGQISLTELRRVLTTYGEDMSEEEVDQLFESLDTDKDGMLNVNEFVAMLLK